MMPATPQQAGKKAYQAAIAAGKEPDEAMVDLVEATMGAVPGDTKAKAGLDYSVDADAIRLRVAGEEGLTLPRNFNGLSDVQAQHSSLLDFMQTYKLMGNEGALNISSAMFGMRSSVYSAENIARQSKYVFDSGVVEGLHKVKTATARRNANFTGFRGDLMTQEDWGRTISAHTQKWAQQDASDVVTLISIAAMAPMLVADLAVLGVVAGRGALTLGRGLMNGADDLGRSLYSSIQANGIHGTVLNVGSQRVSWATVESANLAAMRSMAAFTPASAELAVTQFARTAAGYSARLGSSAWAGATGLARGIGLSGSDLIAGGISGSVNVAFEYAKNPEQSLGYYSMAFGAGFFGGAYGNAVASTFKAGLTSGVSSVVARRNAVISSEIVGGLVSGSLSNAVSQRYAMKKSGDEFSQSQFWISTLSSGIIGGGIAMYLPKWAPNTQFTINASAGSLLQGWQNIYDQYFGE